MKRKMHISLEQLKSLLRFEPETGKFFWLVKRNGQHPSGEAGTQTLGNGARLIRIAGVTYTAPNVAWFYMTGKWPVSKITPKNGDPFDVRWENLNHTAIDVGAGVFVAPKSKTGRAIRMKQYRAAKPDIIKKNDLKKFGISLEDYKGKLLAQNGVCAICEKPEIMVLHGKVKTLSVDHDHTTGEVRDLLCSFCNSMLGYGQDNPEILRKAADYLERHKGAGQKVVPLRLVKENE